MKSGTLRHPKMFLFVDALRVKFPELESDETQYALQNLAGALVEHIAASLCVRLWEWTTQYAPSGALSRWSPEAIGRGIRWDGDAKKLMEAFVESGLIDEAENGDLAIHGWSEHCEGFVHARLLRKGEFFANGAIPRTRFLKSEERSACKALYDNKLSGPQDGPKDGPQDGPHPRVRKPLPKPLPKPCRAEAENAREDGPEDGPMDGPKQGAGAALGGSVSDGVEAALERMKDTANRGAEEAYEELAARFISLGVEEVNRKWLVDRFKACSNKGDTLRGMDDAAKKVADSKLSGNPKGEGEFKEPGRFLISKVLKLCLKHSVRAPGLPSAKGKSSRRAG